MPSASQSCCDRTTVQVFHLHSINKRLTAHALLGETGHKEPVTSISLEVKRGDLVEHQGGWTQAGAGGACFR